MSVCETRRSAADKPANPGEPPEQDTEIVRRGLALIEQRLPPGWELRSQREAGNEYPRMDALVELTGPDGDTALIAIEAKRSLVRRDIRQTMARLTRTLSDAGSDAVPMVAARYLAPPVRQELAEAGACFVDTTGNLLLQLGSPALFMRDTGADSDPWRGRGRPRGTLRGPPAARVVRALADLTPPMGIPELARRSGASTGATYRVVELLEQEELVERARRGPIEQVRWRRLLERWSQDYGFQASNTVRAYLQPRGMSAVTKALATDTASRYAVTGTLAAEQYAPYAPARLAMIYSDDPDTTASALGLRRVDSGANVLLATGDNDVVFDRTSEVNGVTLVAPAQAAVDLLTGPGRSASEATALLDWMETHEPLWRR